MDERSIPMERVARRLIGACLALLGVVWLIAGVQARQAEDVNAGVLLPVTGPIGPATSDFFVRQLRAAEESGAQLVVVRIDTPGGLETAMRDMVQAILAANVPVVTFVAPSGARAASAGAFLVYASHVAAMSPATNLGAATPVQIGQPGSPAQPAGPSGRDCRRHGISEAVEFLSAEAGR